ncbi:YheU family protein [Trichloromonas acetexigens]|uniref:YheU family protein n=1 Tax=Trichloromonas acetexigens TaxID=38815 RepID=A0A550JJK2_9BACT|nr:YheU family protein [Desulfuromonas acetexigens]TRO83396.1 YheU family protein [Desulfuromonas acetexigens]
MSGEGPDEGQEAGIEIPFARIDPETLQRMIEEFVTRDGADWAESGCALEDKVRQVLRQVLRQLRDGQVRVVYDQKTQTANLVPCR